MITLKSSKASGGALLLLLDLSSCSVFGRAGARPRRPHAGSLPSTTKARISCHIRFGNAERYRCASVSASTRSWITGLAL